MFVIKHVRLEKNGTYKYRRRVPKPLQPVLRKAEIVKVLGRTEREALVAYGPYHDHVERLLRSTRPHDEATELAAIRRSIEAQFQELKLDPYSPGRTPEERFARAEEADRILNRYDPNPETGTPDAEDVSPKDGAMVTALLGGISDVKAELTITQAFNFYRIERREPDDYKRKKHEQRLDRIMNDLLRVTGQDIPMSKVGRQHARTLRDNLLKRGMQATSARHCINDVKAVFSLAIREHDLDTSNPFQRLEFPKAQVAAVELRLPLPPDVILAMYKELAGTQLLLDIWTLLHHSGAQNAEVLGLLASDLDLDGPVPHFVVRPNALRSLKTRSRIRSVPLVGPALIVARRLKEATTPDAPLFPRYAATKSHDNFSQVARRRLRMVTTEPKHTIYSLRHNMKDALRSAKVGERVELALLGHSDERTASAQYGSAVSLGELQAALLEVKFDVPEEWS
ncbi:MAG: integrase [Pseudooceanicola nanhaiensis]|uniref:integrase n=1 Tax=Pseudooceanicola nanhaiensis TaxID=375761 RepID=UPI004059E85B